MAIHGYRIIHVAQDIPQKGAQSLRSKTQFLRNQTQIRGKKHQHQVVGGLLLLVVYPAMLHLIEVTTLQELSTVLYFSVSTIRHETMRIYQALSVSDRKEAAKKALVLGLI
jgi:hypothetical protein